MRFVLLVSLTAVSLLQAACDCGPSLVYLSGGDTDGGAVRVADGGMAVPDAGELRDAGGASCGEFCSYHWSANAWSECSTTCGTGTHTRLVSCLRNDQVAAPEARCDAATRPVNHEVCTDMSSCAYQWVAAPFPQCPAGCGSVTQTRPVTCQRSDGRVGAEADCVATGVPKPTATQMCMSTSACTYTWQTGAFGACSSTCGAGTTSRTVSCQRSDGAAVDSSFCPSPGPETSTDCRDCSACATASSLTMRMDVGDLASDGIDVFKVVVQLDTESLQANDSANNIRATTFAELAVLVNDAFFAIDPNVWVTSTADSLVVTDALGRPFETTLAKGTYVAVTATNAVTHWVITATPSRSQCENPN